MRDHKMRLKCLKFITLWVLLGPFKPVYAGKIDLMIGYFGIDAKTTTSSDSLGMLGSYKVAYFHPVASNFEVYGGYTINMSSGFGGDLGYGFDFGGQYYPISGAQNIETTIHGLTVSIKPKWRPFVGMLFSQREFQSVRSAYSGFGINFGAEWNYKGNINWKTELRYITLSGPGKAEATETELLVGAAYDF